MFELVFGIIWTSIVSMIVGGFYSGSGNITVNGVAVTQQEFNAMLFPKLLFSLFFAVGIVLIALGIKKISKKRFAASKGELCYGRVIDVYEAGGHINGKPMYKIDVKLYIPSEFKTRIISKRIGINIDEYPVDSYLKAKYLNGHLIIDSYISTSIIPKDIKEKLDVGMKK